MERDEMRHRFYVRWSRGERAQHWVLAITFGLLVVTGFALRFPESWWAWPFVLTGSFDLRGFVHRLAATLYIALALYHIGYLLFSPRGRRQLRALRLNRQDLRHLHEQLRRNLGKLASRPRFGHYTYWEKIEYWALIWGTVVMVVTGMLLWFENQSLRVLPLWALDVATVIHYYEAILATLSILVWHFYFVIFDPDIYPLDTSMLSGLISEQKLAEEHPGELAEIRLQEKSDERPVEPSLLSHPVR